MKQLSPQPYKGARDYYPEDKRIQNYIFSIWRRVSEAFGYEEYGLPVLEPLEVYAAKSGQELANEQTYAFTDRGGRTVAIRPEATPSVSRMVAAKRQELAYPARLYSIANFMRYERPQRGREREFWQLNVDIFGADGVKAEAEILAMADSIMRNFGAKPEDFVIKVNNRKLINYMMAHYLGLNAVKSKEMVKLFDRKPKITHKDFVEQASEILGDNAKDGLVKIEKILKAKKVTDLPEEIRNNPSIREVGELFSILEHIGIKSLQFDITLMRGLDYYTGMVFEVFDTDPENNRSLFGGGRYDGLVGMFGAEPISAVGMAPGGTTMENFLKTHGLIPDYIRNSTTRLYIAVLSDEVMLDAANLSRELRINGINTELDISSRKLDKQVKTASKKTIPYVLFLGVDEALSKKYTVRDMCSGKEYKIGVAEIVELIKEK